MKPLIYFLMLWLVCRGELFADATNLPAVLTLTEAQNIALHNHPKVAAADYRALAAQEVLKETRAGYFNTQLKIY